MVIAAATMVDNSMAVTRVCFSFLLLLFLLKSKQYLNLNLIDLFICPAIYISTPLDVVSFPEAPANKSPVAFHIPHAACCMHTYTYTCAGCC
jgi:hypothetical protein